MLQCTGENVTRIETFQVSKQFYVSTNVEKSTSGEISATPSSRICLWKTQTQIPKLGVMLVGWGGNNGSTFTAGILANKHHLRWNTKNGERTPNFYGSITQCATTKIGMSTDGQEIYEPIKRLVPMVSPEDIVIGGWDISKVNLAEAMKRAKVLDFSLQEKLCPLMRDMNPLPSVYITDFIASNQTERADNVIEGTKQQQVERLRNDIREFKMRNSLDKVIVLWTANTERFCNVTAGIHDTAENFLAGVERGESEISPSSMFALASILEGCPFINGSPQNTLVPGIVALAQKKGVPVAGDDFKTGQTKLKSVLADFLVSAGIKPLSIVSYNHLGNNDGKNLSSAAQFRSKEISKSNVVDDVVASNGILYNQSTKEVPDHVVVIKYVPAVGDSKRAMDEYVSEIFMGGISTIAIHNTCEDSLLAAPVMLDLVILAEFFTRIEYCDFPYPRGQVVAEETEWWKMARMSAAELYKLERKHFQPLHPVLSSLGYLLKAPMVPPGSPVINALMKQRMCLDNIILACAGFPPESHMMLEWKTHYHPPEVITHKPDTDIPKTKARANPRRRKSRGKPMAQKVLN